ncbi:aldolase/citrate lyase family protein [Melioribacter roseus]|uniref:aldolase/citrate lyase family protein n=1 Tax=Melioribacter roseus TaxID=1134405 RepID=UPI0002FF5BB5|nr:aldolase/citrate lyase family protein [Melioribacter roseus]
MYGDEIEKLIRTISSFYELTGAEIEIEDYGALPYTIAARFETAYKRIFVHETKEFLLPIKKGLITPTSKDRIRRSRLYLPGNEPKFHINAGLHKPDGIILDLEDSVHPSEKDSARILVRNALRAVNFYGAEKMVRINQLPLGFEDLKSIVPHNVHVILIPKCESKETVIKVNEVINAVKKEKNIRYDIYLMPIIESALGVVNAYEIATASKNICALTIGLEDYTADIGVQRTEAGLESFYARSVIVNAAKAAGVQAIDSVYSDVGNTEGLYKSCLESKALGFEGKGCIHPRQIKITHKAFAPSPPEIEKAKLIVEAFNEARRKSQSVISIGSKMIDPPVVKRALKILESEKQN